MALIPLKDTATIVRVELNPDGTPKLDDWGQPIPGTPTEYRCRIDEGTRLTRDQNGREVVTNTQIIYEKIVAVGYDDDIKWTDAGGVERTAKPIRIGYVKDFGGKVLFTEVEL